MLVWWSTNDSAHALSEVIVGLQKPGSLGAGLSNSNMTVPAPKYSTTLYINRTLSNVNSWSCNTTACNVGYESSVR